MSTDASVAPLGARNATLADLAALLQNQQARKVDVVAPAAAVRAEGDRADRQDPAEVDVSVSRSASDGTDDAAYSTNTRQSDHGEVAA